MRCPARLAAALLAIVATPAAASPFTPSSSIDAEVAAFLGAAAGTPGGASRAVDPRLKLALCSGGLAVAWYGRGATTLEVSCPAVGWRVFVAVANSASAPDRSGPAREVLVQRGETVSIVYEGLGFSLTRQGEALEAGAQDQWIKIRPAGEKTQPIRAQVARPGAVRIAAH